MVENPNRLANERAARDRNGPGVIAALIIAGWTIGLVLAAGLCAAARRGDAGLRLLAEDQEAAPMSAPTPARAARAPGPCVAGAGEDADAELRSQAGADLALQSG